MNPITIIKATSSDFETIQEISKQTFIDTFTAVNTPDNMDNYILENFNSVQFGIELNNLDSIFYLTILDTNTIAYLKINFGNAQTEIRSSQSMELQRIYVLKNFLGKKLDNYC